MKRRGILTAVILVFALAGSTRSNATNLIVDGSFGSPNVNGNWGDFTSIPGWNTNGPGIEIDDPAVFGGGSAAYPGNGSDQSLEINYESPEDVYQTVAGLTPGETYTLTWAYGDRPDSGDEEMQVYLGGTLVATDYDLLDGANSSVLWTLNTVTVTATSTSEVLSFDGIDYPGYTNNGGPSYGNELDDVSLVGNAPEPSTWILLLSGLSMLGLVVARRRQVLPSSAAASL